MQTEEHKNEMKRMGIVYKEASAALKKIALEYFHNNFEVNEVILEIVK